MLDKNGIQKSDTEKLPYAQIVKTKKNYWGTLLHTRTSIRSPSREEGKIIGLAHQKQPSFVLQPFFKGNVATFHLQIKLLNRLQILPLCPMC